ncbi:MAG TPA: hypothetical protein VKU85_18540, partial [bacterium]|nr:hypothetical protein [bacterium]
MNALLRSTALFFALLVTLGEPAFAEGRLYWVNGSSPSGMLGVADPDGGNVQVLVDGLDTPACVATDLTSGKVYWAENNLLGSRIQRANLDGTGVEVVVPDSGLDEARFLAIDSAAGKLYWVDTSKIVRANLDGSSPATLVSSTDAGAIALDVEAGHLYWTERNVTPRIRRVSLDGSNPIDLLLLSSGPTGLALDPGGRTLYWTEGSSIWSANLDGSGAQVLYTGLFPAHVTLDLTDDRLLLTDVFAPPSVIDIDGGGLPSALPTAHHFAIHRSTGDLRKVYWSESSPERIRRAGIDGVGAEDVVTTGLLNVKDLAVDDGSGKLFWVDWNLRDVGSSNLDGTGVELIVDSGGLWFSSVDVDVPGDWVYWRDSESFFRVHLDGSGLEFLTNIHGAQTGTQGDLKLDPLGGMVYATYNSGGMLVRFPASGGATDTLVSGINPSCVALDPMAGKMYWGAGSELRGSNLDGSASSTVVEDVTAREVELDVEAGKIYWLTSTSVWRANLDGSNRRRILHGLDDAAGLALGVSPTFENKIYWTDLGNDQIR